MLCIEYEFHMKGFIHLKILFNMKNTDRFSLLIKLDDKDYYYNYYY